MPVIGCYGPIANAAYSLTRGLRLAGYDAHYIREPADRYPMSQPLWEEAVLVLDPARLPDDVPTEEEWRRLEHESGWIAPEWIVDASRRDRSRRVALNGVKLLARAPRSVREL